MQSSKHPFAVVLVSLLAIFVIFSCGKEDNGGTITPAPPATPVTTVDNTTVDLTALRRNIAINLATNIIIPSYQVLQVETDNLVSTIETFTNEPTVDNLKAAQTALKNSWMAWQHASMYLFGPAETVALRKSLNTYPTSRDQIVTNIQTQDYILGSLANQAAIGFPAIDYLLNGYDEATSELIGLYEEDELAANRAAYLKELSVDISERVTTTLSGWIPEEGNYQATFTEEEALGLDVGSSISLLVNSLDLHFQRFARDGKVAIPAGIRSAGIPRPIAVEAFYGGYSVDLLVENLRAYQKLFHGTTAGDENKEGLYDYLVAIETEDLAKDMDAQFTVAINIAADLSSPLAVQMEEDTDRAINLFLEMQKIVVLLKSDMASIMGITITNQDNDGD